jgi:hypothetical protein
MGGVARFDSLLQEVFPKRIFMKAQEESQRLYEFCLEHPQTTLVITDNQHACDVPQNIPCIIFHHGVARTYAERDPDWNSHVRDLCVNGQDNMFLHRLPQNTMFISISKFCSDEFKRHYGSSYERFHRFLLPIPIEDRISSKWLLTKTKTKKDRFADPYHLSTLKEGDRPRILGDWSTKNKGSELIPLLQEVLKDEFEFIQLQTPRIQHIDKHRKNVEQFYKNAQMYFQVSTSEGSSFAAEDGLAYGLLVIASNVGQFYETPPHVASTYDWQKRSDIPYLANKIRTSWKQRENYNAVEWMRQYLDWNKWKCRLHEILQTFVASLPTNIIQYPVVHRNPTIFWQHPVITEKYCMEKLLESNTKDIYVAIPYATIIDKNKMPVKELISIRNQINAIKSIRPNGTRIYSSCQHIHYRKILDLAKQLGITDMFLSHKRADHPPIEHGIRIHGLPLYPVNVFDTSCSHGIPDPLPTKRQYLFSFVGAHMQHYLNPIRKKILSWDSSPDWYIQDTNIWHFEKDVYQHQVHGMPLTVSDRSQQHEQTMKYNRILADSTFSLCPVGAGPNTIRLWESICLSSIPVLIADEFDIRGCIPYHDVPFYIQLPYNSPHLDSAETLADYLSSISEEEKNTMRKGCQQIAEYLRNAFLPLSSPNPPPSPASEPVESMESEVHIPTGNDVP